MSLVTFKKLFNQIKLIIYLEAKITEFSFKRAIVGQKFKFRQLIKKNFTQLI